MNFIDTYDITGGPGAETPPPNPPQQSLNEEVNQVIGQLGRFWGGFRKQSQSVLETARKDFGGVVVQAQKELTKLTAAPSTSTSGGEADTDTRSDSEGPLSSSTATLTNANAGPSTSTSTSQSQWSTQNLFSRLQSSLPPNVVSTVQNNIPESLKHASENIDLAQLRTNLFSEFQRIQGVTRAQAEEYVHKSESLLREAVKEAGEVLREAVKVIPPEEVAPSPSSGLIWDGSDMWMLPSDTGTSSEVDVNRNEKGKSVESGVAAVATRAEALLRRLKHDPSIIRHDPGIDESLKEKYSTWVRTEIDSKDGGIEGAEWQTKISEALDDSSDGPKPLADLKDTLVPAEINEAEFWKRFFFRVYQIKEEEEKRKALLQATTSESEEDFDWDDGDSDAESEGKNGNSNQTTPATAKAPTPATEKLVAPMSSTTTRESSLDSYDVVSSGHASVSGDAQLQPTAKITTSKQPTKGSDNEEEDDDGGGDDDEEDEEDEDSDWE